MAKTVPFVRCCGLGTGPLRARPALRAPRPATATPKPRSSAAHALLGLDVPTVAALILPASGAVALAYWLAEQQDNIRPGDALPTPSARDEDGTVSVDENPEVYSLGVPVRLQVGPVGDDAAPRTFYVRPAQGDDSSRLVTVSVERPCGVVFEQSEDGSVFVAAVQAQSNAARQARLAQLVQRDESFQVGDVLRAFVTTNTVYDARAQLGVSLPQRELQFVSLDDYRDMPRSWQLISEQLGRGRQADGPAQFVLERQTSSPS